MEFILKNVHFWNCWHKLHFAHLALRWQCFSWRQAPITWWICRYSAFNEDWDPFAKTVVGTKRMLKSGVLCCLDNYQVFLECLFPLKYNANHMRFIWRCSQGRRLFLLNFKGTKTITIHQFLNSVLRIKMIKHNQQHSKFTTTPSPTPTRRRRFQLSLEQAEVSGSFPSIMSLSIGTISFQEVTAEIGLLGQPCNLWSRSLWHSRFVCIRDFSEKGGFF